MSSKKYPGESIKEYAKIKTKYMPLSQLTNTFLTVNNFFKKEKASENWDIRTRTLCISTLLITGLQYKWLRRT